MDEEALCGLFEKCVNSVEHKLIADVFLGVGGYVSVRAKSPVQRDDLRSIGIKITYEARGELGRGARDAARKKNKSALIGLRNAMRETVLAYRFFTNRAMTDHADEMAQILRTGLSEHLGAVDALAGLAGLLDD